MCLHGSVKVGGVPYAWSMRVEMGGGQAFGGEAKDSNFLCQGHILTCYPLHQPHMLVSAAGIEPANTRFQTETITAFATLRCLVPLQGIEPCVVRLQGGCIAINA